MRNSLAAMTALVLAAACGGDTGTGAAKSTATLADAEQMAGFVDLYWEEATGHLFLEIGRLGILDDRQAAERHFY